LKRSIAANGKPVPRDEGPPRALLNFDPAHEQPNECAPLFDIGGLEEFPRSVQPLEHGFDSSLSIYRASDLRRRLRQLSVDPCALLLESDQGCPNTREILRAG